MNSRLRLRCVWCVFVSGILFMPFLPSRSWLHQVVTPYYTNNWVRFFAYAAASSIPCIAWRKKKHVLYCFAIIALGIVCELFHIIAAGQASHSDVVFSDLFGIAAGILLGLNLRLLNASVGKETNITQSQHRSTPL